MIRRMVMNVFRAVGGFFKGFGKLFMTAMKAANEAGLDDDLIKLALGWVRVAESKFIDPAEKREFVIKMIVAKTGLPTSVAALALELAIRLLKKELNKIDEKY